MNKSLKLKAVVILAVILICVYAIVGLPKSKEELIANWSKNIRLGLDLKGGSHLVLQVQVQDAFIAEAGQVVQRLKDELTKAGIAFTSIDNTEPKSIETADQVEVNIKGVPIDKVGAFRSIVTGRFTQWNLVSVSSSDYRMT